MVAVASLAQLAQKLNKPAASGAGRQVLATLKARTLLFDLVSLLTELVPEHMAMGSLVSPRPKAVTPELSKLLAGVPDDIRAGVWLYLDDLERSHHISQSLASHTGSFLHAVMHRREGDFWNSKYWYRNSAGHPVLGSLPFDPMVFVDEVESRGKGDPADLVQKQRAEWLELFSYSCWEALA